MNFKLLTLTTFTMIAFAANSVFCRLALIDQDNSPLSFTLVRVLSGAIILSIFFFKDFKKEPIQINMASVLAPITLFFYALFFSLSYVNIDAGLGALILFACVQITMITSALAKGQKMNFYQAIGFTLALAGFVYLLLPGAGVPPLRATGLMITSGVCWGVYSLLGQGVKNPIFSNAQNFIFTFPLVLAFFVVFPFELTKSGAFWAVLSGSLTSGLGYTLWYIVLKDLVTSTASIVQLSVPALAILGGVVFLHEPISFRLVIATTLIFIGIVINITSKTK